MVKGESNMNYWGNFYNPQGLLGKMIVKRMNCQHKSKEKWILNEALYVMCKKEELYAQK